MKNLFYLAAFVILFMACSDDEPEDPRNKFVGDYYGTQNSEIFIDNVSYSTETSSIKLSIKKGNEPDVIIIEDWEATIDNNEFHINEGQISYQDFGNGTSLNVSMSGFGRISSNGSITNELKGTANYNGVQFVIEMKGTFAPE